jgi:5-methylthioadenosine/S-adenosylhomocysteine deaminase
MSTLGVVGGQVLRPDMTVERGDVLVDRDAGTIAAVGEGAGEDADETLDATDGLVIPGLVNAHAHVAMTLLRGYADDKPLDAWLREDVWPVEAELQPADVAAGARLAAAELIRSGTTAFADMYFEMDALAEVIEEVGLRARLGHGCITVGTDEAAAHEDFETGLAFAREYDGSADGRITTALMPHSLTTAGEQYLREYVPRARELGVPVHLHANETEDEVAPIVAEHGVRPLEYADEMGVLAEDTFLAHCVHVDEAEIDLLAERGTAVVHCPASNMKLASGMAPVQRMLDAGVTVGLGTDGPASNNDLDVFDEIRDAAMIGKLAAEDASAVDAETAVELATAGSAAALGIDSGRLEPGANADIAVVDLAVPHLTPQHDLLSHLAYAARGSDVRHTVCDGRVLMRDKTVLTVNVDAARKTATDRAEALIRQSTEGA